MRINKNNQILIREINAASSVQDLRLRFQAVGAPPLPDALMNQPFALAQRQAKELISQATSSSKLQGTTPYSPEVTRVYWQSVKLVLLALLSAFCFATASW